MKTKLLQILQVFLYGLWLHYANNLQHTAFIFKEFQKSDGLQMHKLFRINLVS